MILPAFRFAVAAAAVCVAASALPAYAAGDQPVASASKMVAEGATKIAPGDASKIADALMSTAPADRPQAELKVGDLTPGQVDLRPLPTSVGDIAPELRGYQYVVGRDRIAIVQQATRRIVEIIAPAP